jgi:RimJ/RimL family protein N-acetyltransferase
MNNVIIRPLEITDAKTSWRWRNDKDIWQLTGKRPLDYISLENETKWIERVIAENNSMRYAILVDAIYIGNIQLTNITEIDAEFHIFIGNKDFWGRGFAQIATAQFIYKIKRELKIARIYLFVHPENRKAINLYLKSNFKAEDLKANPIKMILELNEPNLEANISQINEIGVTTFKSFFSQEFSDQVSCSLERTYKLCRRIQLKNRVYDSTIGTVHHLLADFNEPIYLELLNQISSTEIFNFISKFFNGNFILNAFGGVINLPNSSSYVGKIHRDVRFFCSDFPVMLNMLIMLDDFTLENGATHFLQGSHKSSLKPESDFFYKNSNRFLGRKGDIVFFNSYLWHASGINYTPFSRRAITINFSKPFLKPQFDYLNLFDFKRVHLSDKMQQILGHNSRIPSTLEEWYQLPEKRFYKPNQD